MWVLFVVPTPTTDGHSAQDLYQKRVELITPQMQESARGHGCRFHQAWYAQDGSAFYAIAQWDSVEGATAFFTEWDIDDEPGEVAIRLQGEVGLVTLAALSPPPSAGP
jgi:hypothetical protein